MKRFVALVSTALASLFLLFSFLAPSVYAVGPNFPGVPSSAGQGSVSTCAYENMGWVICPVLRATSQAGDNAFTFVSQNFLAVDITFYDAQSGAAQAGAMVRNFANVLFVFAFLIIVYSLITGRGVGNYNIKRLVPRFILAVVFVNLSYYICQAMVDLSNVIGVTIQQLLVDGVAKNIGPSAMPLASGPGKYDAASLSDLTSQIISMNNLQWILLAPLTAIVMTSAIVCSILIVVLIIRKALIVALVLLAPLAFFAYLLPNTSEYFSKWMKLFASTLLLFPVIAILIGVGQIVSASIIRADSGDYKVDDDTVLIKNTGKEQSATLYLVAAGAAILPLAGTWYAFKAAMQGMETVGARVSRDGFRRSSRERDEKAKKREQTTMDMNKKSMMLRGINRLQQLNVAKDGESNASIFGRVGGAYRGRGKHQTKTPEQAKFDNQVQQRLNELRGGAEAGRSPQELYSQALQRYQDRIGDASEGGLNINSYEGIDLKASEAYLLESLGKGGGSATAIAALATSSNGDKKKESQDNEKKSAGISSLNRDGKSSGAAAPAPQQDSYRPPTTGGATGGSIAGTLPQQGNVIIVQQAPGAGAGMGADAAGGAATSQAANGTGFMARRPAQGSNETLAKARAAKYVSESQDALGTYDELIDGPKHDASSDATSEGNTLGR
jgi:hypothetical protein